MLLPNDYDSARAFDGNSLPPVPVGGHICKIVGARETKSRMGNDMIEIAFDIAEGGPHDGRFKERFESIRAGRADAKWPNGGMFRAGILTRDGKTNPFFKGVITAIEESNPGYSFKGSGCNVDTMKGKLIGFNFGEDEYKANDNSIKTVVKPFYAVSVQRVREGIEPPAKKALRANSAAPAAAQTFTEVQDDQLPF